MLSKKVILGILLTILMSAIFIFVTKSTNTFAAGIIITGNDLGIQLSTTGALFNAENMAPGDTSSAGFTVKNDGKHDFSYTLGTVLQSTDRMLYDRLIIEVKDSQGNFRYRDVMSGLEQGLELGTVTPGGQEDYVLTVLFPYESGNEYQGKTANVNFVFSARTHGGDIEPGTGVVFEHPFINTNFKLKLNSTVPIKFHLVKPDGSLDGVERDVQLIIKGPDANGVVREYVFNEEKGNLKFDGSLEEPHYIALLSSFDCSLKVGGSYSTIIKLDDNVLGTRDFVVDDSPGTSRSNSK